MTTEQTIGDGGENDGWKDAIKASVEQGVEAAKEALVSATANTPPRIYEDFLPCLLTEKELSEQGQLLAAVLAEVEDIEAEKKSAMEVFKGRIEKVDARAHELAAIIRAKSVKRAVECHEFKIYELGLVRAIRVDTGEQLNERAMTSNERQRELELPDVAPSDESEEADAGEQLDLSDVEDGESITDPEALLREAEKGHEEPAKAKGKRGRKG